MKPKHASKSAAVRARLDHPIIDSDGHQVEFGPIFLDFLKEVGGAAVAERYKSGTGIDPIFAGGWRELTPAQRNDRRAMRPTWWACPARNTRDLATATFPKLFHERMPEMGLDVSVIYPTRVCSRFRFLMRRSAARPAARSTG